ncbi:MAG: TetR/AcrR family transcriptional regulator, partial [Faecalibacterium sp.]|nr:TetR/AcrR family transcriptional regulator [Faecalibacterium sp.]
MTMEADAVFHKPTFDNIPQEKRNKILSVAVSEFATKGFENANINTIAKKAEVSVGSLYKYFATKTDLFLTSVNYGVDSLEKILGSVISSDEDIMIKLEKLVRAAIEFSRKNCVLIKLYNEFTTESNAELGSRLAQKMETITAQAYKHAIIQGQVAGDIRTDIDPGMAAFLVDNMLTNVQFSYACEYYSERYKIYAGNDIFEKDEFAIENILRFIKAALEPKQPPMHTAYSN